MVSLNLTPPLRKVWRHYERTPKSLQEFLMLRSQPFGANPERYARFGLKAHNGTDWGCVMKTPVQACHEGESIDYATTGPLGNYTEVRNPSLGVMTRYSHLHSFVSPRSSYVKQGETIAFSGNTGNSSGPHLDLTVKLLNANGSVKDYDNGYFGAVDSTPYFVWYNDYMDKEVVRNLYRLAFYRNPTGKELNYWQGKDVSDFLNQAIDDRAKFLAQ